MPDVFHTTRRVEFCETDAAGIAHFSAFFLYMEQAEHALLRSVGLSVSSIEPADRPGEAPIHLSWPRVKAECEYHSAARFEAMLDVAVRIARLGEKSVSYAFEITAVEPANQGRRVASGRMTSVCCSIVTGEPPRAVAIPGAIRAKLAPFVFGA